MRTEALGRAGAPFWSTGHAFAALAAVVLVSSAARAQEEPGDRLRWRGTGATFSHSVTTTALGVGAKPLGPASEQYVQGYTLLFNWFAIDGEKMTLRLATAPGADVEITDSDTSARERELLLRDLPLTASVTTLLHEHAYRPRSSRLVTNGTVLLPTSKASRNDGTLLVTSPRVLLAQRLPLDEHPLEWVELYLGLRWDHRFSRATEPVSPNLDRPRTPPPRTPIPTSFFSSDQLSGVRFARDVLRADTLAVVEQPLGRGALWFEAGLSIGVEFLDRFDEEPCAIVIDTGCVEPRGAPDASSHRELAGFGATLYYFPFPEAGLSLGYSNQDLVLAPSGQRRSPLYAPSAVFTASLIVGFDALWLAAHGRRRESPYFLPELL